VREEKFLRLNENLGKLELGFQDQFFLRREAEISLQDPVNFLCLKTGFPDGSPDWRPNSRFRAALQDRRVALGSVVRAKVKTISLSAKRSVRLRSPDGSYFASALATHNGKLARRFDETFGQSSSEARAIVFKGLFFGICDVLNASPM
jgi:hypothetical protein